MNSNKKAIWGRAIYDWANSAFATTVMAGFFPIFFKQYWNYNVDVNMSTARLGLGNDIASIIAGLMAPILGPVLIGFVGLIARHILMPPFPSSEQFVHVNRLASRWGIASISLLFIMGATLLFFVDKEKGKQEVSCFKS